MSAYSMNRRYVLMVLMVAALSHIPTTWGDDQQETAKGPVNLDFERDELDRADGGWFVPSATTKSYAVEFTAQNAVDGERCVQIKNHSEPAPGLFGNVMQSFPADSFRGRRVEFRAYVRTELLNAGSQAQLWMRVDRKDGQRGFFDNMGDRPIKTTTWSEVAITGPIADDAEMINIGCMLIGTGKAWVDAAKFEIVGNAGEGLLAAKAIESQELDNLVAFARLFGYVRHFHPSDGAAKTDWDDFAIRAVRVIEKAKDAQELAKLLQGVFEDIAPTVRVFPTGTTLSPEDLEPPRPAEGGKVCWWQHHGYGTSASGPIYTSERVFRELNNGKIPSSLDDVSRPSIIDLKGGVSCFVPLVLFADDQGTLPHSSAEHGLSSHPNGFYPSPEDRATRLADVVLIWNILQHFYPYFDVVQTDWAAALPESLKSAAMDPDAEAFLMTLQRLVAQLHDGHGNVSGPGHHGWAMPPVLWDWVEDSLVVTKTAPDYTGKLKPGDTIIKVNGIPAAQALAAEEELISSSTPQWRRANALYRIAAGEPGTPLAVEIKPFNGPSYNETLYRNVQETPLTEDRPEKIAEVSPGVFYVDLDRITDSDFNAAMDQLERAKGLIFDLRGYPKGVNPTAIIGHFIDEPITCPQWHVPVVKKPNREGMKFMFSNWPVMPVKPRLTANCVYITGGGAISYAETWMGMIENYKLAAIVGGPTAGTNGNINPISLPGGYRVTWTGMKVLKHDGSPHHGVGIQPTIPANRTVAGVAQSRDELLERAIAEVLK